MANRLDDYLRWRRRLERAEADAARSEGAYGQALARLSAEAGCTSEVEAEALLEDLRRQEADAEAEYGSLLERFEAKWGEALGGEDGRG